MSHTDSARSTARTMHEALVGLQVVNEAGYQRYRAGIAPLLEACGGRFRYDFRVGEVLRSETPGPINRVFVIAFPSVEVMRAFFADPAYLAVRKQHFEPSVGSVTSIAAYARELS